MINRQALIADIVQAALRGTVRKSQPASPDLHVPALISLPRRSRARRALAAKAADYAVSQVLGQNGNSLAEAIMRGGLHGLREPVAKAASPDAMPLVTTKPDRQLVYCVVLEPGLVDEHDEVMDAPSIEQAAHGFLARYRVIGAMHRKRILATPVESYIAPQDLVYETGSKDPVTVKKGSWVLGVHMNDPEEWRKVRDGTYTGLSVGGFGARDEDEAP